MNGCSCLFVLCNAPTIFMQLMNDVLHPYLDSFVIVYLNGILVYISTWKDHISHFMQMLETLKKIQLLANPKKCEFYYHSMMYLEHAIGGGELKIDHMKMDSILKWLVSTNVTKFKSFFVEV
jgi:hypothetical protein